MKNKSTSRSAFLNLRILFGLVVFFVGALLALFAAANPQSLTRETRARLDARVGRSNGTPLASLGGVQEAWAARYNGSGNGDDEAAAITVDASGSVYVTGYSLSGFSDYVTIKYNSAGQEQWVARYDGAFDDYAEAIAVDNSGNIYVTGRSFNGANFADDYATIKYNSAGQQEWVARYNGPGNFDDEATAIAVDSSGNVYVTGVSTGEGTSFDYTTIKYNSGGQQQWISRYNGPADSGDVARDIAIDNLGNVYVTGNSWGTGDDHDYATIKYDSAGQEQWVARYNGPGNNEDIAVAVAVDTSGDVYVTGSSFDDDTCDDYTTIKYNSAAQEQWVARYNGPENGCDEARAIAIDSSGNVYVTGESLGSGTSFDYATIKYDSGGQEQWASRYSAPGNDHDRSNAITVDGSGNVYVTGWSSGSGTALDYATIKYVQGPTPTPTPTPRVTPRPRPTPHRRPTPPQ